MAKSYSWFFGERIRGRKWYETWTHDLHFTKKRQLNHLSHHHCQYLGSGFISSRRSWTILARVEIIYWDFSLFSVSTSSSSAAAVLSLCTSQSLSLTLKPSINHHFQSLLPFSAGHLSHSLAQACPHTHTRAHANTRTHAQACTRTSVRTRISARTHTCTSMHTRTRTSARTVVRWSWTLSKFFIAWKRQMVGSICLDRDCDQKQKNTILAKNEERAKKILWRLFHFSVEAEQFRKEILIWLKPKPGSLLVDSRSMIFSFEFGV